MSQITLPGSCSWFYLIELDYNYKKGFGITTNEERRLRKGYCYPSASIQRFCNLYYGKRSQIQALERWFKNEYGSECLILVDKKLEWIDPRSELNDLQKIVDIIENRIRVAGYSEVYRIKKKHLPYEPSNHFKNIVSDADRFLEPI
jgi:hypothetical protein